ncbi:MAG: glycine cleavage system aminomethyltransferase GcvT [Xanthomonadales bacterium]|nr:glycine cleavage system aminomethyltransferase GcvT [Xanthomonadales bacterium]MDH3939609.1 glycine cleavage system aminomethyltransferase GcvT [Xanthomonadales bacterium]MDH4001989.1 glycine cleavage system aminomethyltransferase GcvT [Xanthomonadales bacterium]
MRRTSLYDSHLAAGARMVDFGGWEMPINYGSQLDEHHQVRTAAGMFDVSHMTVVDIHGPETRAFLSNLLANDVAKLTTPGQAFYSCMLKESGGVMDDLIAYFMNEDWFRLVVNATTRDKGLAWLERHGAEFSIAVTEHHELSIIAVQGPEARQKVHAVMPAQAVSELAQLKPFSAVDVDGIFVARTGYTGEDGYEILISVLQAEAFWDRLLEQGVKPCGLGARDTLRLEAGMNLYGQDMTEEDTPLVSGLAWTVAMRDDREFIGRKALEKQKMDGVPARLVGLVLEGRGVLRPGQKIITEAGEGVTTSGSFSPTLQKAIALARVPAATGDRCEVEIRGKHLPARIVKPPFVRKGKACEGIA